MKIRIKEYWSLLKQNYQKILQKIKASKLIQKHPKFLSCTAGITVGSGGAALLLTSLSLLITCFSSLFVIEIVLLIILGLIGIALFPLAYYLYKKLLTFSISDEVKDRIIDIIDIIDGEEDKVE